MGGCNQIQTVALFPGPSQIREKGSGHTCAKIPVCAVSAVFIWSKLITLIQYQLLNPLPHEDSRLVPRPFKNGNEASRLFVNLEFQKFRTHLHLLDYYSCLAGFSYSRPISRSVHLLCNAIVNSSWLSRDHVRHINTLIQHIREHLQV